MVPLTTILFKSTPPFTQSNIDGGALESNIDEGALVSDPVDHDQLDDDISYTPSECSDDPESEDEVTLTSSALSNKGLTCLSSSVLLDTEPTDIN